MQPANALALHKPDSHGMQRRWCPPAQLMGPLHLWHKQSEYGAANRRKPTRCPPVYARLAAREPPPGLAQNTSLRLWCDFCPCPSPLRRSPARQCLRIPAVKRVMVQRVTLLSRSPLQCQETAAGRAVTSILAPACPSWPRWAQCSPRIIGVPKLFL